MSLAKRPCSSPAPPPLDHHSSHTALTPIPTTSMLSMTPDICPPLQTPPVPLKSIASMLALKCGEKQLTLNVYGWQKFESRQEYYKTELSLMFAQDTKKKRQMWWQLSAKQRRSKRGHDSRRQRNERRRRRQRLCRESVKRMDT